jgi:hypothetical protein
MVRVWRDVTHAELHSGRGSVLGPDTSRRTRWWELVLTCGHRKVGNVRYRKTSPPLPKGTRRASDDVLPAPRRVSCPECGRN